MALRFARFACLALLITSAGCPASSDGYTLRVDLKTDYRPVFRFETVQVQILEGPTDASGLRRRAESPADAAADYLTGVRVASFSGLPEGTYLVDVALLDGSRIVANNTLELRLVQNDTFNAVITADCEGLTCPGTGDPIDATQCVSGRCVPPDCTPETPEACPTPICTSDSECAAAGDCLTGRCVDGNCFQSPDDSACPSGTFCDATGSCEPVPVMTDMGSMRVDMGPADMYTPPVDGGPPRPTISFETPQPGGCIDLAMAYPSGEDFVYRRTITGAPNRTATQWNDHVSCGDPREAAESFSLDGSGYHQDTFHSSSPIDDCWSLIYGRWDVTVVVDGVRSVPDTVTYYNSACPNVDTCAEAADFCSPCRFCDDTEYCYNGLFCAPEPELTIETATSPGCVDLSVAHTDPPATNTIITGRPNATSTQYNHQVSCPGATRYAAEDRPLGSTGRVEDALPTGAADCSNTVYGRWEVDVEVDGEVSNTVEVVYYNSGCTGITTCNQARTFCPD
jgi:hypothetical protein